MHNKEYGKGMERLTLELLEWPELCRQLASYALSSKGAELCRGLLPWNSKSEAAQQMALTSEMVLFLQKHDLLTISEFGGVEELLGKAEKGQRLLGRDLAQVAEFLGSVARARRALLKAQELCPGLWGMAQALDEAAWIKEAIDAAIDSEGSVKDQASPRLRVLRKEARQRREAILRQLEDFLRRTQASGFLQDNYYTLRENRFVLPIRAEARARLGGIVHDISSSGATCFLEPPWLVELNNNLRMAELEAEKEAQRILEMLSRWVGQEAAALRVDLEVLATVDMIQARARLSGVLAGCEPKPAEQGELLLRGLRHPLLVLRGKDVVANDLWMAPQERVMVISGPNAGGKTVFLKALGLAALMARAGLHIPAQDGSRMPFFGKVLADIGDQQDIQQDFSTFSAHMRNLREILQSSTQESLVLLDELAGSTDPQEGAALALSILERLMEKGSVVVATTHYPQVKAWAQEKPGALNGALEFDWERLTPTFRMRQGIPGQSSALEIARKMQLPEEVLEPALRRLEKDEIRLEGLLRDLQLERKGLEEELSKAQATRSQLEELVASQEELVRSLKEEREGFLKEKRRRLSAEIQEARERIRELLAGLAGSPERRKLEESRMKLEELAHTLGPQPLLSQQKVLPLGDAKPGDQVHLTALGQTGILLDEPSAKKGRVRVLVGRMEVWVDAECLGRVESPSSRQAEDRPASVVWKAPGAESPAQLDLRGKRAEDALEELAAYLDKALLGPWPQVRIIHGHGTGALKRAVRKWLSESSWIPGFRPGRRGEGGDGVTVVCLRGGIAEQELGILEPADQDREKTPRRRMDG